MKKYLAIGSIVVLKEGTKKVMIYGRKQMHADTGEIYDYVACFYPEGNISPEYTFLFNDEDIREVVFKGFSDNDNKKFIEQLNAGNA
ncbi:MAG: DUF4176 domain-containing protein [Lachnospiraceae bacterium]